MLIFDPEFYKLSYFKNPNISDEEALKDYCLEGASQKKYPSAYAVLKENEEIDDFTAKNFSYNSYKHLNPCVGEFSPLRATLHYRTYGFKEGRKYLESEEMKRLIAGSPTKDDGLFHFGETQKPKVKHHNHYAYLNAEYNSKDKKVLEIGSRSVISNKIWQRWVPECNYTGFDFRDGDNVDVIGDAHKLSNYFEPNQFDAVISLAVFEHLAMPWIVAEEIHKVLRPGGVAIIETHFSFSEHELPWHFFQFNSRGLEILFNKELGFEVLSAGLDNPLIGRFSNLASPKLRGRPVNNLYCHSSIVARKIASQGEGDDAFSWRDQYDSIIGSSEYPELK